MKPLYLIDFSNFVYKFKSTYKTRKVINGVSYDTSPVYGFIRSLKANPFKDIMICLDGHPKQSLTYLPCYKGQRLKEPEESLVFPKLELIRILSKLGESLGKNISVVCSANQEADQVIASIAYQVCGNLNPVHIKMQNMMREPIQEDSHLSRYQTDDLEIKDIDLSRFDTVVIGTTDSDMYQLLSLPSVLIDTSTSGKQLNSGEYTPKAVEGLIPSAIPAYKAIVGDISDNVPEIKLTITKKSIIELINKNLYNTALLKSFIKSAQQNKKQENPSLQSLADYLRATDQITKLSINNKVTELMFVTTPKALVYN